MIAEEELGQDYNPEDEDIAFIDDDSESDNNYDTKDCICQLLKMKRNNFFHLKIFQIFSDYKNVRNFFSLNADGEFELN